eukprot:558066-Rhodomonas_salina.1
MSGTALAYAATFCYGMRCPTALPLPTRCPRMMLRICYAVCGTERAYAATRVAQLSASLRLGDSLCCYAVDTRCPPMILRAGYAISGTDLASATLFWYRQTWPMLLRFSEYFVATLRVKRHAGCRTQ